ncbi:MAG: hypothetical protein KIT32_12120 [Rhodocyclaceae bacterium]|nr:hypothetical protein [Rhodocyclaceae bacterium]
MMDGISPTADQQWLERDRERRETEADKDMRVLAEPLATIRAACDELARRAPMIRSAMAEHYSRCIREYVEEAERDIRYERETLAGVR